ncbi:unnamed protein product [Symbiodinium sp. CCMP2592]|nr:unnamed protein product [Symbiodinium sp. CCMP2592]
MLEEFDKETPPRLAEEPASPAQSEDEVCGPDGARSHLIALGIFGTQDVDDDESEIDTEQMTAVLNGFLDKNPDIRDVLRGRPRDHLEFWLDEFRASPDPEKDAAWLKACLDWDGEGEPPEDPGSSTNPADSDAWEKKDEWADDSAKGAWADDDWTYDRKPDRWTNDWDDDSANIKKIDWIHDPTDDWINDNKTYGWTQNAWVDGPVDDWTQDDKTYGWSKTYAWVDDSTEDDKTYGWSKTDAWVNDSTFDGKAYGWSEADNWADDSARVIKVDGWTENDWADDSAKDNKTYGWTENDWADDSTKDDQTYGWSKTEHWDTGPAKDAWADISTTDALTDAGSSTMEWATTGAAGDYDDASTEVGAHDWANDKQAFLLISDFLEDG